MPSTAVQIAGHSPGQHGVVKKTRCSSLPGSTGRQVQVRIHMLDESVICLQVPARSLGVHVYDILMQRLQLLEADYFDLEFVNDEGVRCWLDHTRPFMQQVGLLSDLTFFFSVRFYTPHPNLLEEEYTRYLFSLQIKRDLSSGQLIASESTAALLASYIVQGEIGDFLEKEYINTDYLRQLKLLPDPTQEQLLKVMEFHRTHLGMSSSEADYNLLDTARKVEHYGIRLHPVKDRENLVLNLSVAHTGVIVYQNATRINSFSWAKMRKISFKRKRFIIKFFPENSTYPNDVVEFYFDSRDECKRFWKKCVEHHAFFRRSTGEHIVKRKCSLLVSKGSSYRYVGRTEKELTNYVRQHVSKRPRFERPSNARTASCSPSTHPRAQQNRKKEKEFSLQSPARPQSDDERLHRQIQNTKQLTAKPIENPTTAITTSQPSNQPIKSVKKNVTLEEKIDTPSSTVVNGSNKTENGTTQPNHVLETPQRTKVNQRKSESNKNTNRHSHNSTKTKLEETAVDKQTTCLTEPVSIPRDQKQLTTKSTKPVKDAFIQEEKVINTDLSKEHRVSEVPSDDGKPERQNKVTSVDQDKSFEISSISPHSYIPSNFLGGNVKGKAYARIVCIDQYSSSEPSDTQIDKDVVPRSNSVSSTKQTSRKHSCEPSSRTASGSIENVSPHPFSRSRSAPSEEACVDSKPLKSPKFSNKQTEKVSYLSCEPLARSQAVISRDVNCENSDHHLSHSLDVNLSKRPASSASKHIRTHYQVSHRPGCLRHCRSLDGKFQLFVTKTVHVGVCSPNHKQESKRQTIAALKEELRLAGVLFTEQHVLNGQIMNDAKLSQIATDCHQNDVQHLIECTAANQKGTSPKRQSITPASVGDEYQIKSKERVTTMEIDDQIFTECCQMSENIQGKRCSLEEKNGSRQRTEFLLLGRSNCERKSSSPYMDSSLDALPYKMIHMDSCSSVCSSNMETGSTSQSQSSSVADRFSRPQSVSDMNLSIRTPSTGRGSTNEGHHAHRCRHHSGHQSHHHFSHHHLHPDHPHRHHPNRHHSYRYLNRGCSGHNSIILLTTRTNSSMSLSLSLSYDNESERHRRSSLTSSSSLSSSSSSCHSYSSSSLSDHLPPPPSDNTGKYNPQVPIPLKKSSHYVNLPSPLPNELVELSLMNGGDQYGISPGSSLLPDMEERAPALENISLPSDEKLMVSIPSPNDSSSSGTSSNTRTTIVAAEQPNISLNDVSFSLIVDVHSVSSSADVEKELHESPSTTAPASFQGESELPSLSKDENADEPEAQNSEEAPNENIPSVNESAVSDVEDVAPELKEDNLTPSEADSSDAFDTNLETELSELLMTLEQEKETTPKCDNEFSTQDTMESSDTLNHVKEISSNDRMGNDSQKTNGQDNMYGVQSTWPTTKEEFKKALKAQGVIMSSSDSSDSSEEQTSGSEGSADIEPFLTPARQLLEIAEEEEPINEEEDTKQSSLKQKDNKSENWWPLHDETSRHEVPIMSESDSSSSKLKTVDTTGATQFKSRRKYKSRDMESDSLEPSTDSLSSDSSSAEEDGPTCEVEHWIVHPERNHRESTSTMEGGDFIFLENPNFSAAPSLSEMDGDDNDESCELVNSPCQDVVLTFYSDYHVDNSSTHDETFTLTPTEEGNSIINSITEITHSELVQGETLPNSE